jgi:hypothetical protein
MASTLTSKRIVSAADPLALYELSLQDRWGDGFPVLPPTEERVNQLLEATRYPADHVVVEKLHPVGNAATVEKIAINAAMAGCEPEHLPFVIAGVEAIGQPGFHLEMVAASTSGASPTLMVNGPSRDGLGFDYSFGCLGGATGRGSRTVGRALALCMRNIGDQKVGLTSMTCLGQPARFGLCFAEWEQRSPWPSVAEQRGFTNQQDVVHAHGSLGVMPLMYTLLDDTRELIAMLARSIAFPATLQMFPANGRDGHAVLLINPDFAARFGREFPEIEDFREFLWDNAYQPIDLWPKSIRHLFEEHGRVDSKGRVHVNERPDQLVVAVCGAAVDFNAAFLPNYHSELQSRVAVVA